jgi:hypothetical protein
MHPTGLLPLALLAACTPDGTPLAGPGAVRIVDVELLRPAPDVAPLLWTVDVRASEPVRLDVGWTDGEHEVAVAFDGEQTDHRRDLIGFRAGHRYAVEVTVTTADGRTATREVGPIVAEEPPSWFPRAELVADPDRVAPGHTLLPMRTPMPDVPASDVIAVYDEEGYLCHWIQGQSALFAASEPVPGEPLLAMVGSGLNSVVAELSWAGEVVRWWTPASEATGGIGVPVGEEVEFHHDAIRGEDGGIVAIGRQPRYVGAYPSDYLVPGATAPATISDDLLVRFGEDGRDVSVTALSSLLPVTRIGFDSLEENSSGSLDWAHANAVLLDPSDGGAIVSLRNQDAIVKIRADAAGRPEVEWILGNHANWTPSLVDRLLDPAGELEWPYHQHGPELVASDARTTTLVVFDNGNHRDVPFDEDYASGPELSRVVSYTIDRVTRTVRQDWAFVTTSVGPLFSQATGNAEPLENGDVLAAYGFLTEVGGIPNADLGLGQNAVRVIELDPVTLDEVWHLSLSTPLADNPSGWFAYRAHRIPSLYGRVVD